MSYQLTLSVQGTGYPNPSPGTYSYASGTVVQLTYTTAPHWIFDHWVIDGVNRVGTPYQVVMNANHTVVVVFIHLALLTILHPIGNGTIRDSSGDGPDTVNGPYGPGVIAYNYGATVLMIAAPDTGWVTDHWTVAGLDTIDTLPGTDTIYVPLDGDHTVQVSFIQPSTLMIATPQGNGSTYPQEGLHSYELGSTVNISAFPSSGWSFDHWALDGISITDNPLSILMDTPSRTVQAVFIETAQPPPPVDYSWLILGGLGLVGIIIVSGEDKKKKK